jgi:hypothetical protein
VGSPWECLRADSGAYTVEEDPLGLTEAGEWIVTYEGEEGEEGVVFGGPLRTRAAALELARWLPDPVFGPAIRESE